MSPSTQRPPYQYMLRKLKAARDEAGLSQGEVAEFLGATQTFVSKVERGERRIDPVELTEFAAVYAKDLDYFLLRPDSPRRSAPEEDAVETTVTLAAEEMAAVKTAAYERGESEDSLIREAIRKLFRIKG